jgi:hypothetical protein
MSINNYLTSSAPDKDNGRDIFHDYRHASRLYIEDLQARAPKYGFLYYVNFVINESATLSDIDKNVGMFVRRIDLPKFSIKTETLNQYNRKTVVQTKLEYTPISMDFHDDNSDITNSLWINYYRNSFADSRYEENDTDVPTGFGDTKYGDIDYTYGMYDRGTARAFFKKIDVFVMHHTKHTYTKISLINPKITEWKHDSLDQSEGTKVLRNSMTVAYDNVLYYAGQVSENRPVGFVNELYDTRESPLKVGGNNVNRYLNRYQGSLVNDGIETFDQKVLARQTGRTIPAQTGDPLFDKTGVARKYNTSIKTSNGTFDAAGPARPYGLVGGPNRTNNQFLDIAGILAKDYLNKNGLGRIGPVGYNIASSALNAVTREGAGKYYDPPKTQDNPGIFNLPGGIGINVFKGFNTSVDGKIRANPAALIFSPKR